MGNVREPLGGLVRLGRLWRHRRASRDAEDIIVADLSHALGRAELRMHYQPVVDAADHRVVAVEALLRWHAKGGLRPARDFIEAASAHGLLREIDETLLGSTCGFVRELQRGGAERLRLAVNLDAGDLAPGSGLVGRVRQALQEAWLMPHWLQLEVREADVVGRTEELAPTFSALSALGVSVTIDDYEARGGARGVITLPAVRAVKIDVLPVAGGAPGLERLREAADVAREAGLEVTVKRVETPGAIAIATHLGCDYLQGFAFGAPMRPMELLRYLSELGLGKHAEQPGGAQ